MKVQLLMLLLIIVGIPQFLKSQTYWENNFDNASDWVIDNDGQTDPGYGWEITDAYSGWNGNFTEIISTSGGNFAQLLNGDPVAGNQAIGVTYELTTSTAIDVDDLGGTDQITLQFQQYGARFNDAQEVYISLDGVSYQKVYDNNAIPPLTGDGGAQYDNPSQVDIDLESFLGGIAPTDLYIRFSWTSIDPLNTTDPNLWVAYAWMIDDVKIIETPGYNLEVLSSDWSNVGGYRYYQVPQAQVQPVNFSVEIKNSGLLEQTNVQFNLDLNNGEVTGASPGIDMLPGDIHNTGITYTNVDPAPLGLYTFERTVTSDFTAIDENPSNLEIPNVEYEVTDYIYARDNGNQFGFTQRPNLPFEAGNAFEIHEDQTIYSLDVFIANADPFQEIYAKLYEYDAGVSNEVPGSQSSSVVVSPSQVGSFVNVKFDTPIELEAGKTYITMIGTQNNQNLRIGNAGQSPNNSSFLFYTDLGEQYFVNSTPMVRMNFSEPIERDLSMELITPAEGSNLNPANIPVEFNIVNNGPDAIEVGEIFYVGYQLNGNIYSFVTGNMGEVDAVSAPYQILSGEKLLWSDIEATIGTFSYDFSSITELNSFCVRAIGVGPESLGGTDPADPDMSNNSACFTVEPYAMADFTLTTLSKLNVCPKERLDLTVQVNESFGPDNINYVEWFDGATWTIIKEQEMNGNGTIEFGVPTAAFTGNIDIRVRSTSPVRTQVVNTINITNALPNSHATINGASTLCLPGEEVYLIAEGDIQNTDSYEWNLSAGLNLVDGANTNSITVSAAGENTDLEMYVLSSNECGTINRKIGEVELVETGDVFVSGSAINFGDNYEPLSAEVAYVQDDNGQYTGCVPFPDNSFDGKIALIDRGGCFFSLKAYYAELAGAVGVVLVNNTPGEGPINLAPGPYEQEISIPVVSLSFEDGETVKTQLAGGSTTLNFMPYVFSLSAENKPVISSGTLTDPSECGLSDGSIEVLGTGSGTLEVSGTESFSGSVTLPYTVSNLPRGNYSVNFSNDNCAAESFDVSLNDPDGPDAPTISVNGDLTFCDGGSVELISSASSNITWSNTEGTQSINVTQPGSYTVTVEEDGCTSESLPVEVVVNPLPVAPVIANYSAMEVCLGESVSLESNYPENNEWSFGGTNPFEVTTINSVGVNSITVTYTDENNCSSTSLPMEITGKLIPELELSSKTETSSCGASDATATFNGVGNGTLRIWNTSGFYDEYTGALPLSANNLPAGNFNAEFEDDGCYSATILITINDPDAPAIPVISAQGSTTICQGESVTLSSSYSSDNEWSTGAFDEEIVVSTAGLYTVTVTDGLGCSSTSDPIEVVVNNTPATPQLFSNTGSGSICEGETLIVSTNYEENIEWSTGEETQFIDVTVEGTIGVTYTDENGCSASNNAFITVNELPELSVINVTNPSACGEFDGEVELGGTTSGTLSVTGTTNFNTSVDLPDMVSLGAGNYQMILSDGQCSSLPVNVTLNDPNGPATPVIQANPSLTICEGESVELTSSSAADNTWNNGETTPSIVVSAAGEYAVSVTDGSGCTSTSATVEVVVKALPAQPTISANGDIAFCEGGSVELSASESNGVSWSTNESSQSITVDEEGSYSVTYTDLNGCSSTSIPVSIVVFENPSIDEVVVTESACDDQTGTAVLTVSGGQPSYTENWFGEDPNALGVGSYDVEVIDDNNCSVTETFQIESANAPEVSVIVTDIVCAEDENGGSVSVDVTGGTPTFGYTIDGGENYQPENVFEGLAEGTYTVSVLDDAGCEASESFDVTAPDAIIFEQTVEICNGSSVLVGESEYDQAGEYTDVLEGAAINGCDSTVITTVEVLPEIDNGVSISNATLTADQSGSEYVWVDCDNSNEPIAGETSQSFTATENGSYAVIITDGECSVTSECVEVTGLSVKEIDNNFVRLFPNPNNGTFTIVSEYAGNIKVFDFSGKLVYETSLNSGEEIVSLPSVSIGTYTVKFISAQGVHVERLVVKN